MLALVIKKVGTGSNFRIIQYRHCCLVIELCITNGKTFLMLLPLTDFEHILAMISAFEFEMSVSPNTSKSAFLFQKLLLTFKQFFFSLCVFFLFSYR